MRHSAIRWPMLACALAGIFAFAAASAADAPPVCGPLKLFNEVQLQMIDDGLRPMIPVKVNGHEEIFIFDTGSGITAISEKAAKDLGITVSNGGDYYTADVFGNIKSLYAKLDKFEFGKRKLDAVKMSVWPQSSTEMRGSFGLYFMLHYDADIDFGTGKFRAFERDHCPGQVVYWQAQAVGVVPVTVADGHLTASVELDGHKIDAIIDTGAEYSVMPRQIAQDIFGLTDGAPGTEFVSELSQGDRTTRKKAFVHTFATLSFGDIQAKNTRVLVKPDFMSTDNPFLSHYEIYERKMDGFKMPDLIIGMNVLRRLHVYMAFGENKLYVSPASAPGAAAQPAGSQ